MADMKVYVGSALASVPVNKVALTDDTDFKTQETAVAYNAAGMALKWNFMTTAGTTTQTAVTPTTGGVYDWAHAGGGMYTIEIPASGGASINNDTKGFGWFSGVATGVLSWSGPVIEFADADADTDIPYFTLTRGAVSQTIELMVYYNDGSPYDLPLAYNTAGLTAYYYRQNAAGETAITLATMTLGTWASEGLIVVDNTNMPGLIQLGLPNAMIANSAGVDRVTGMLKGAANMKPCPFIIELVDSLTLGADNGVMISTDAQNLSSSLTVATNTMTANMTEAYPTDGTSAMTPAQALYAITQTLTEFARSGTTVTIKKRDASTTAFTLTLDSATTPTSTTQAS